MNKMKPFYVNIVFFSLFCYAWKVTLILKATLIWIRKTFVWTLTEQVCFVFWNTCLILKIPKICSARCENARVCKTTSQNLVFMKHQHFQTCKVRVLIKVKWLWRIQFEFLLAGHLKITPLFPITAKSSQWLQAELRNL